MAPLGCPVPLTVDFGEDIDPVATTRRGGPEHPRLRHGTSLSDPTNAGVLCQARCQADDDGVADDCRGHRRRS